MTSQWSQVCSHVARIAAVVLALVVVMLLPYSPGNYDGLALTLSVSAQLVGIVGLLLVPVGALWLRYELRKQRRLEQHLPHGDRRYLFAVTTLVVGSTVAIVIALAAVMGERLSIGILGLALWMLLLRRLTPPIRRMRKAESERLDTAPLYLVTVPVAVLLLQIVLARPAVEFGRNRVMAASATMIEEIEAYNAAHGHYPETMLGLHKDWHPSVMGVDRYHYARRGATYNIAFEQPLFLLHDVGAREVVVYNPLDEHVILSHAAWNATWTPQVSATRQGWFAAYAAGKPHWKYFRFD